MNIQNFFTNHPVFTYDEFRSYCMQEGNRNQRTVDSLLTYHIKVDRLIRVRRGLFVVVPTGINPAQVPIDPYLVAAKMTTDAVLAYHTALEFHGKAYSIHNRFYLLTKGVVRKTRLRDWTIEGVMHPKSLRDAGKESLGVTSGERMGVRVQVTSLERTLVDILDRPDLGGGWEEVWRSAESVEYFDLDKVLEYALMLGKATTIGKVGFFLESHRERLFVSDAILEKLRVHRPREPHYLERGKSMGQSRLVSSWNIVVPERLFEKSWEESS